MPTAPNLARIKPAGAAIRRHRWHRGSGQRRQTRTSGSGLRQICGDLGYKPFYFDSIFDRDLYFAGSVERRTRELEEMFVRDEVRAILCARGGYGSNYLLDRLDLKKIKAHPKIFVGYSDLTTLLTYFADAAGLVTFQGPMVAKDFAHADGVDLVSWEHALHGSRNGRSSRMRT